MEGRLLRDVIAAAFAITIALPEHLAGAAALADALEVLAFAVDFPIGIDVEVLGNGDECHLVVVGCVPEGEEIRVLFDFG